MWGYFTDFLSRPWKGADEMSGTDWALFIGLILIILLFWGVVLAHLREALEG